ncbi:MAG: inositol monophosphatase family protein [Actinomycetota bacterium]|nr:inositol monophosphatase family protein [Actinomycetota bacterium]
MTDTESPRPVAGWSPEDAFGTSSIRWEPLVADLAATALEAAQAAAAVIAGAEVTGVETKISATDMVSDVDRRAETAVAQVVTARRPDDEVLGEEGTSRPGTSGIRWVVDPLDGTTNFLFSIPHYSVSIAAERDGEPVAGVVIDPCRQEIWAATAGYGSFVNGRRCSVADGRSSLETALCATGFGYRPERRRWQAEVLSQVLPRVRDIRRFGSAALDLCWVAGGRYDAYFEWGLNRWDRSAGLLIAAEAGATVGVMGQRLVAAAPPSLFLALCDLLEQAGAFDARPGPEPDDSL